MGYAWPARLLAGDGSEYRSALLSMGLRVAAGTKARNLLTQYLQTRQPAEIATCADRVGWHQGSAYVFPRETIQREAGEGESVPERIVYQGDGPSENPFRRRGTLAGWRERVAALCVGNSRLAFAVSCAFAGPLMRPAGIDSGGFHMRGDSSCGKTTVLRVAGSVWGGPSYLQRWRATDNALEAVAAQHCDGLLILDELAQVDPRTAGECAYMLANETSKARSTRTGQTRPRLTWLGRLLFLSAGEIGLAAHMAEGGKRVRTGQELRMTSMAVCSTDVRRRCPLLFPTSRTHAAPNPFNHCTQRSLPMHCCVSPPCKPSWACRRPRSTRWSRAATFPSRFGAATAVLAGARPT